MISEKKKYILESDSDDFEDDLNRDEDQELLGLLPEANPIAPRGLQ